MEKNLFLRLKRMLGIWWLIGFVTFIGCISPMAWTENQDAEIGSTAMF